MTIYKRDISTKLLLIRCVFVLTILLCIYLFWYELNDYAFLLALLICFCAIIPVTWLIIKEDSFTIKQFYVFGFVPRTWTFAKGETISIQPFDLEISDAGYLNTDSAWDAITALSPTATMALKRFVIKRKDIIGKLTQVKMKLSDQEQKLIQESFVD